MSVTIFGEYFRPMRMQDEIFYYTCMALAVVLVLSNLYLAVRVLWKPKRPKDAELPRSRISSRYLICAGIVCLLIGILLISF